MIVGEIPSKEVAVKTIEKPVEKPVISSPAPAAPAASAASAAPEKGFLSS